MSQYIRLCVIFRGTYQFRGTPTYLGETYQLWGKPTNLGEFIEPTNLRKPTKHWPSNLFLFILFCFSISNLVVPNI
jgi:hypothetical protein